MTGLGTGEVQTGSQSIRVEIKSVNSRFLEISCRLPSRLSRRENAVRELIRKSLVRGKIYVQVSISYPDRQDLEFNVNKNAAVSICRMLEDLRDAAGIDTTY